MAEENSVIECSCHPEKSKQNDTALLDWLEKSGYPAKFTRIDGTWYAWDTNGHKPSSNLRDAISLEMAKSAK